MSKSTDSQSDKDIARCLQLPSKYKLLGKLGEGGFGVVMKCLNVHTNQVVAVKIQDDDDYCANELHMMKLLKENNLHQRNIIRFMEKIPLKDKVVGLVFEMLDVNLQDFIIQKDCLLDLNSIRSIIQQMAKALDALKSHSIIHGDIKQDNIMLVNAKHQPFQVRLIDFGSAFQTHRQRQVVQPANYKAPEVILGLPLSEAMDMWSLGIVMMEMLTGDSVFSATSLHGMICNMVKILGVPPDHLLEAGVFSSLYFKKGQSGQWKLKTPEEYLLHQAPPRDIRTHCVTDLNQVEELPLPNLKGADAAEVKDCIDLLKAMLRFDASQRITPSQVLSHPFIRNGKLQQSSVSHREVYEPPKRCVQVIHVKPASPENCLELDPDSEEDSYMSQSKPHLPPYFKDSSVSDDIELEEDEPRKTKKKKKKKIFTRFYRWVKRKVFCCTNVVDIQQ